MKLTDEQIIKACGEVCGDNRFELIKKYKQMLFEHTNIETANDQVAVIDDILFRFWQMGWLDKLEEFDRQKAEVERLKDSIKEADEYFSEGDFAKGIACIINLLKEMVGDTDEE